MREMLPGLHQGGLISQWFYLRENISMASLHSKSKASICTEDNPDSKIHGANMGPIWGRQDPSGPHVGPMNFAIWEYLYWSSSIDI